MLTDNLQVAIAVASFLGASLLAWWRVTSRVQSFLTGQIANEATLRRIQSQIDHVARAANQRLDLIAKDVIVVQREMATLAVLITEREKDIDRLEASMRKSMTNGSH